MDSFKLPQSLNESTQASVSFIAFLLSILLILTFHLGLIKQYALDNQIVLIEIDKGTSDKSIEDILDQLRNTEGIDAESIELQYADEAFKAMLNVNQTSKVNPFGHLVTFSLDQQTPLIDRTLKTLEEQEGVLSILQETLDQRNFDRNATFFGAVFLGLTIVLAFWAIYIVITSIRRSLLFQQEKILTMQLVGARKSFIWMPLRRSTIQKLIKPLLISNILALIVCLCLVGFSTFSAEILSWIRVIGALLLVNLVMLFMVLVVSFAQLTVFLEQHFYEQ